jgi:hypothetical protein
LKNPGTDFVTGSAGLRARLCHHGSNLFAPFRAFSLSRSAALDLGGPARAATLLGPHRFRNEFF